MEARSILTRGFWDFTTSGLLFVLLSGFTAILRVAADWHKDSKTHHDVLVFVENAIFFSGAALIVFTVIYLLAVLILDLVTSFRQAVSEKSRTPADPTRPEAAPEGEGVR